MTPTIALAITPEALDNVLQYLEKHDVWAVALTCKALLPACLRSIWQTLEVTCESPIRRPGSEREFGESLCNVIEKYWMNASWLQYVKFLNVGRYLNADSPEASVLLGLLENAQIPLLRLKAYSETRLQVDFSINLVSTLPLTEFVDLPKVSHLTVQAPFVPHEIDEAGPQYDAFIGKTAKDLAIVLDQIVNLKHFGWVLPKIHLRLMGRPLHSDPRRLVQCLQDAFKRLKYLISFRFYGFFLHPTVFIVPPHSIRELKVEGIVSREWWKAFSGCPLPKLTSLTLRMKPSGAEWQLTNISLNWSPKPDCLPYPGFQLHNVTSRGLRTVVCEVDDGPSDIMDDLLRAIPHPQRSANEVSKIADAKEIVEQCSTLFFGSLLDECKRAAEERYRLRAINQYGNWGAVRFSAEFGELVIKRAAIDTQLAPQRGTNLEPPLEIREWCRAVLQGCVEKSLNYTTGIHTEMLEGSQADFNGSQFFNDCATRLRTLVRESLNNSQSAAFFVFDEVESFQKKFKTFKRRITDAIAERLVAGEKIGIVEALSIWIEAMVAHDRELYRIGYLVE
ncbi:hypothetical protein TWF970_003074 [Orbilia oligospora]|uniref:F-box domain-containing protein n=1 Tax=Orbilia oligospora TaxID=2813651 RepID=A0A7C8RNL9_ORBOL|nr:hypothetical protein TWF970_003074 [Orbilia oligospora]